MRTWIWDFGFGLGISLAGEANLGITTELNAKRNLAEIEHLISQQQKYCSLNVTTCGTIEKGVMRLNAL
jgi:hypothetical protein